MQGIFLWVKYSFIHSFYVHNYLVYLGCPLFYLSLFSAFSSECALGVCVMKVHASISMADNRYGKTGESQNRY